MEARAAAFRQQYDHLSHLWTTPLQASLQVCVHVLSRGASPLQCRVAQFLCLPATGVP